MREATRNTTGTGPTGCGTLPTARLQTRTAMGKVAATGELRGCCMQAWRHSLWGWLSTSWAQATRASKLQPCGWLAPPLSWRDSPAAYCGSYYAYLPSHAAVVGRGPTTRRTEDCQAVRAKRCRWRGAGRARARRNARQRGASTRPAAMCRVSPAARRTSVCVDTALPRPPRLPLHPLHRPSLHPWRPRQLRAAPRPATSRSLARTANSCSVQPSCAPNPQAINVLAILRTLSALCAATFISVV